MKAKPPNSTCALPLLTSCLTACTAHATRPKASTNSTDCSPPAKPSPLPASQCPKAYLSVFAEAKETGEDVLVLGLTSTISGTVESARMAARLSGWEDHIAVMDSKQAIVSQRIVVEQAVRLRSEGLTLAEIVPALETFRDRIQICGILDTLSLSAKRRTYSQTFSNRGQYSQNQADCCRRRRRADQPRQSAWHGGGEKDHLETPRIG